MSSISSFHLWLLYLVKRRNRCRLGPRVSVCQQMKLRDFVRQHSQPEQLGADVGSYIYLLAIIRK